MPRQPTRTETTKRPPQTEPNRNSHKTRKTRKEPPTLNHHRQSQTNSHPHATAGRSRSSVPDEATKDRPSGTTDPGARDAIAHLLKLHSRQTQARPPRLAHKSKQTTAHPKQTKTVHKLPTEHTTLPPPALTTSLPRAHSTRPHRQIGPQPKTNSTTCHAPPRRDLPSALRSRLPRMLAPRGSARPNTTQPHRHLKQDAIPRPATPPLEPTLQAINLHPHHHPFPQ